MARHPCGTRWQARKVTGAFICSLNESGEWGGEGVGMARGGRGERGTETERCGDETPRFSRSAPAPPFFLPLSLLLSLSRAQSVLPLAIPLISLSLPLCPPPCRPHLIPRSPLHLHGTERERERERLLGTVLHILHNVRERCRGFCWYYI